ncbi:neurogenic locus notch homolog protein 1-like [Saccostrea echinata]|uniref:neurogenic locus notch homolog protein 1-like n=1 Tax=Saccostrea echinata TaxID=191078 RepID=UPI002A7FC0F3|nr:neurogenic locus notch homolog protein 1-like [Saccostrea echinata]
METVVSMIFFGVCAATPLCLVGRDYIVENCVRYRCIFGRAIPEPCPLGLSPTYKGVTGCSWSSESECITIPETGKIIDPCSGSPCLNGGRCLSSSNGQSYLCSCPPGYQGPRCQIDENECLSSPCMNGGICLDGKNGFTCQCPPGEGGVHYTGRHCETKISKLEDVCTPNPCHNEGYCSGVGGSFICYCTPKFSGPLCNETMSIGNPCSSRPCLNSGICSSVRATQFKCFCSPGFTGKQCEQNQDPCSMKPCMNGGVCFQTTEATVFGCACPENFTGRLCETAILMHPCRKAPCKNGGYCTEVGATYRCNCRSGYTGSDCTLVTSAVISSQCDKRKGLLLPHPSYCQLYYNCSAPSGNIPSRPKEKFLDECPYPQLFSTTSRRCEAFNRVDCGKRQILWDFCDYWKQKCRSVCKSCSIDHPSCMNKADGIHSNPMKPNSPYYMACYQNRTVYVSECQRDRFGKQMVFHENKCTSSFDIARAEGGRRPVCADTDTGIYSDPGGECNIYYMCQAGVARVMQCSDGKIFHYQPGKPLCQEPEDVCQPCGTKAWYGKCHSSFLLL